MEIMDRGIKITRSNMETYMDMLWDSIEALERQNSDLTDLVESKENTIEEIQKAFDESEKDNDDLKDKLMDLENDVDYLRNGKTSDEEELY